jgi:hypothetical protein
MLGGGAVGELRAGGRGPSSITSCASISSPQSGQSVLSGEGHSSVHSIPQQR